MSRRQLLVFVVCLLTAAAALLFLLRTTTHDRINVDSIATDNDTFDIYHPRIIQYVLDHLTQPASPGQHPLQLSNIKADKDYSQIGQSLFVDNLLKGQTTQRITTLKQQHVFLAQLVELPTLSREVPGSIPGRL
jgi:hypothetical protein